MDPHFITSDTAIQQGPSSSRYMFKRQLHMSRYTYAVPGIDSEPTHFIEVKSVMDVFMGKGVTNLQLVLILSQPPTVEN